MMEEDGIYPPRFEVQVCGSHANEPVNAIVEFRGMAGTGPDTTELLLEPTKEGVLKYLPSSCSCSIILCSLNVAAGGTASMQRFHPLSALHSRSEPVISAFGPTAQSFVAQFQVHNTIYYSIAIDVFLCTFSQEDKKFPKQDPSTDHVNVIQQ